MATLEILSLKDSNEKLHNVEWFKFIDELNTTKKSYVKYDKIYLEYPDKSHSFILEKLSDAICAYMKFRCLNWLLKDIKLDVYDKYALLGALLSVDKDNDIKYIFQSIFKLKIICIESLFELRLCPLVDSWERLGLLAKSLVGSIHTKSELYELIAYFMSNYDRCVRLVITDSEPAKIIINGEDIPPYSFTESSDYNLLISVMRESPTNIVIKNQDVLSPKLIETFRALGK